MLSAGEIRAPTVEMLTGAAQNRANTALRGTEPSPPRLSVHGQTFLEPCTGTMALRHRPGGCSTASERFRPLFFNHLIACGTLREGRARPGCRIVKIVSVPLRSAFRVAGLQAGSQAVKHADLVVAQGGGR
jgi:hypothetical protein